MQIILTGDDIAGIVSIICMTIFLVVLCWTASKSAGNSSSIYDEYRNRDACTWYSSKITYVPKDNIIDNKEETKKQEKE